MTITAIQQASYQRRALDTLKKKVQTMELAWVDVDGYFENRLGELVGEIEKIQGEMAGYVSDMKSEQGNF